ncbi:SSI family serine proteinase inhibitor [Actinomadura fibrosa]|uniref:SSI family serine proteinase inhibitor n=1 Tax=Actinomadura fibrosa TaxID=111802 RepID=A0ABW2XZQ6_9ACTN|nr:SSI family serine proteinase inhibitor [Actinomadura fibrosa]
MPHLAARALAGTALAAGAFTGAALPGTASAEPAAASAQPAPGTSLRLTLTYPGRNTSGTRSVTLQCAPTGGSHPSAARACAELAASHGAIDRSPDGRICLAVYAPVVARAEGRLRGAPVSFRTRYGNDCVMRSRTGSVFDF